MSARIIPVWNKSWDVNKQQEDKSRLSKQELATYDYVEMALPVITSHIGGVLKIERPLDARIDLSGTVFKNGDWQRVNLRGANLENAELLWMDLRDAQLDGVTQFAGLHLYSTNWWHAKSINKPLLDYLRTTSPCTAGKPYGPRDEMSSEQDCESSVRRLTSQLK
ncbi:MAG: hypothetical protein DME60_09275 [Verrucomicrobia bacterium]|nr:MAG: hypothetical protein DME60_09275 [Verrucomicrobiota bacterium]